MSGDAESPISRRDTEDSASPTAKEEFYPTSRQSVTLAQADPDGVIDENLAANEGAVFERCFRHTDDFAAEGLRTLLFAYRHLEEDEYTRWKRIYQEATTSLVDRQDRIESAGELIEQGFELAGASAIEDKLQDGVPDTIDKFRRANIKVWMLTGDKRETAINIGHSARVCKPASEIYVLDSTSGSVLDALNVTLKDVRSGAIPHSVLVIDGQTLADIDSDESLSHLFYELAVLVDSVICCRASPSQKANLVKSIRNQVPNSMTLAIGDGANDIGMIQASHVGIGISGKEGLQAARIADYSIAQFRFLQRLLFVHGRYNYIRTGQYILATFWKELTFFLVQAHYQRFTGYSGTSFFENWSLTVFNGFFTSLPVIILGVFDRDLMPESLLKAPELYTYGQKNRGFNFWKYLYWSGLGAFESLVLYWLVWGVYDMTLFTGDTSLYAMGTVSFTVGVIFINVKLLVLEMHSKTIISFIGLFISLAGWFVWNFILGAVYHDGLHIYQVRNTFRLNFGRLLSWWAAVLLVLSTLIVLELVLGALRRVYFPSDQDMMQRAEKDGRVDQVVRELAAARGEEPAPPPPPPPKDQSETARGNITTYQQDRRGQRPSYDGRHEGYAAPSFTPSVEERTNPFDVPRHRPQAEHGSRRWIENDQLTASPMSEAPTQLPPRRSSLQPPRR